MKAGDTVKVNFPGHALHGKRVKIEHIDPRVNLYPDDSDKVMLVEIIFVSHPSIPEVIGMGRGHLRPCVKF